MKYHVMPRDHEIVLKDDALLSSKTDLKGRVTYANRQFVELAGYSEDELLGTQHNIVRHPDMPRGVFHFLWKTIADDQREVFAYVKNMAKDGSFYWVFANVTPSFDAQGQVAGYYSVRRKPSRSAVATMSEVYRQMMEVEQRAGSKDACEASLAYLQKLLSSKGTDYETFILSI
jgi:PAS domain S-box-containing protein